jgi:hypothetical protein
MEMNFENPLWKKKSEEEEKYIRVRDIVCVCERVRTKERPSLFFWFTKV